MSFTLRSSKTRTLQSLLVGIVNEESESIKDNSVGDEAIAVTLLYLQQHLGKDCNNLSSVIATLCLLLHSDTSNATASASAPVPSTKEISTEQVENDVLPTISLREYEDTPSDTCKESTFSITVAGASGDLAKKKIFPALFAL